MIRRRNIAKTHRDTFAITFSKASSIANEMFGVVPVKAELCAVYEVHNTAGNHASAVSGSIERLQAVETTGQGDVVATGIDLKGTASTSQAGTVTLADTRIFEAGDRVGFVLTGNSQTLAGMFVTCLFRPVD